MRFSIVNLGCKVNRVESDTLAALLLSQGGVEAAQGEADVVVVNTCTVTGEAEKKARKAVRRALRDHPAARVVVTGCAAAIDPATYRSMDPRVDVVARAAVEAFLFSLTSHRLSGREREDVDRRTPADLPPLRVGEAFRTRVAVKVQDGCDNACTYCIVHVARGRATSRGAADVEGECVALARSGVKEIVLTGINLGSYRDARPDGRQGVRLDGLASRLLRATDALRPRSEPPTRFRISSIEPRDVDDALIDLMAKADGRLCRHLHLPLQSGSDKVLREMARPYDVERYVALVDRMRALVPTISLSTDVIVGFPGETDDEFHETLDVVKRCGFSKVHVFPYSARTGTPAAARADHVPSEVRAARAETLRALGDVLRAAEYDRRVGTHERVLVEGGGMAMTESYYEVAAPHGSLPGSLIDLALPPRPFRAAGACGREPMVQYPL